MTLYYSLVSIRMFLCDLLLRICWAMWPRCLFMGPVQLLETALPRIRSSSYLAQANRVYIQKLTDVPLYLGFPPSHL